MEDRNGLYEYVAKESGGIDYLSVCYELNATLLLS